MAYDKCKPWIIHVREGYRPMPVISTYQQFCGWRGKYNKESARLHTQFLNSKITSGFRHKAGLKRREIEKRLELRAMKLEFDSLL